jgi:hypothetical protein
MYLSAHCSLSLAQARHLLSAFGTARIRQLRAAARSTSYCRRGNLQLVG